MSELYQELLSLARTVRAANRLAGIQAGSMAAGGGLTDNQVLEVSELFPAWEPGTYEVGEVRNHGGQTWRCVQAHDSTATPDWAPGSVAALWAPYHAADPAYARPWIAPTGAHDAYQKGECMVWTDGAVYRCLTDGTVHDPAALPGSWEAVDV